MEVGWERTLRIKDPPDKGPSGERTLTSPVVDVFKRTCLWRALMRAHHAHVYIVLLSRRTKKCEAHRSKFVTGRQSTEDSLSWEYFIWRVLSTYTTMFSCAQWRWWNRISRRSAALLLIKLCTKVNLQFELMLELPMFYNSWYSVINQS